MPYSYFSNFFNVVSQSFIQFEFILSFPYFSGFLNFSLFPMTSFAKRIIIIITIFQYPWLTNLHAFQPFHRGVGSIHNETY